MLMHANWGTGYFDSRRTGQGVLHNLDDPKFLDLCDNILATTDADELKHYAEEVQQYYSDNLPGIAIYWMKDVTPINKEITGWYSSQYKGIFNEINFLNIRPAK
ncbi:MAG: ABC transporter substrate-binding protein, partial [Methanomicrobiales archaeon]|nr:ABC transporter substrate-binding protein [Methanomicrobiales archaeon]